MVYCLNPHCSQPQNAPEHRFCTTCGSVLALSDRYRAVKPLGSSQRCQTWLATDDRDPYTQYCVLKQIALRNPAEFAQVVEVFQVLGQHPQIPQLVRAIAAEPRITNFRPTLVQQWFDGTPLTLRFWDAPRLTDLLRDVLPLLHWVHSQGILHRDLNPQNLLQDANGDLILVDFSLAKVTQKASLARVGTVVGSAAYTAPEQLRGQASPASDLYSLGLISIHLLTGVHPFDLFDSLEGLQSWVNYLPAPVEPHLIQVLNRLTAEALRDRFLDAATAYTALTGEATIPPVTLAATFIQGIEAELVQGWHCTQTCTAHRGPIHAIACHPQQPRVATAGADRQIYIWQAEQQEPIAKLTGHRSIVTAIAFVPQTATLISGSWDYTLRDWQGGKDVQRYEGHTGWVTSLVCSPDGQTVASGSTDCTVRLWDVASGQLQHTFTDATAGVHSLAIQPAGKQLAAGTADATIYLWSMPEHSAPRSLIGHQDVVQALCFSPSGQLLFSGDKAGQIRTWRLDTGQCCQLLNAHQGAVHGLALLPDGDLLATVGHDQTLKLWHPASGRLVASLTGHTAPVLAVAYHPVLQQIVTAASDRTLKFWRLG